MTKFAADFERIDELDGLRALSIMVVIFGHYGLDHLVPGTFGVTLFFFVSGFLITRLLFAELSRTGGISIPNFYIRRIVRLAPALYVSIAGVVVLSLFFGEPLNWISIGSAAVYLKNYQEIYWPQKVGWLVASLGILWSLAVEEHFYLVFPPLFRRLADRKRTFLLVVVSLLVAALVWRLMLVGIWHVDNDRTYKASDTRYDSILYGVLLSIICEGKDARRVVETLVHPVVVGAAFALLLVGFVIKVPVIQQGTRFTSEGLALLSLVATAVFGQRYVLARTVLRNPVMVYIGRLSYSLYLWHYVVLSAARALGYVTTGPSMPGKPAETGAYLICAVVSFAMAAGSYHFVELQFMALRKRFGSKTVGNERRVPVTLPTSTQPVAET